MSSDRSVRLCRSLPTIRVLQTATPHYHLGRQWNGCTLLWVCPSHLVPVESILSSLKLRSKVISALAFKKRGYYQRTKDEHQREDQIWIFLHEWPLCFPTPLMNDLDVQEILPMTFVPIPHSLKLIHERIERREVKNKARHSGGGIEEIMLVPKWKQERSE